MKINVDSLHEVWLGKYASFGEEYLSHKYGAGTQQALVLVDYNGNDRYEFEVKHRIAVPNGAGKLCLELAKAAQTYIAYLSPEDVINDDIKEFPKSTFCLYSLLYASYPRNTKTSIFKRNVGGTLVLSMADEEISSDNDSDLARHVAFAGLGVLLHRKFRSTCPSLSDDKAIEAADGYYISFPS